MASKWIISARWDVFVCLSTVWFPLLVWAGWRAAGDAGLAEGQTVMAVAVIGLSIPHFLTTFTFTWLDADQRRYYRRSPLLYFVVPAALILGSWIYCGLFGPVLLVTVWLLFGEHHVAAQNIGFLALYRQRAGEGETDRRLDHLVFNSAWIATATTFALRDVGSPPLTYHSRPSFSIPYADRDGLVLTLLAFAVACMAVWLGRWVWRAVSGPGPNWPKLLFMVTTWPSFLLIVFLSYDVQLAVIVRIGYHSVQYLALVHLLNVRRVAARTSPRGDLLEWLVARGPATYFVLHVACAGAIYALTDVYGWIAGPGNDWSLRFLFFPGVPLAHFFLDGLTWRLGTPHGRDTVVPFLGREPPPAVTATMSQPAALPTGAAARARGMP